MKERGQEESLEAEVGNEVHGVGEVHGVEEEH